MHSSFFKTFLFETTLTHDNYTCVGLQIFNLCAQDLLYTSVNCLIPHEVYYRLIPLEEHSKALGTCLLIPNEHIFSAMLFFGNLWLGSLILCSSGVDSFFSSLF